MPTKIPKQELPKCGICQQTMVRMPNTTKKETAVYVCNSGRPNSKMPCDGPAFEIALKNI